jgi:hypothetical protein
MTVSQQLHNSASHKEGWDAACPVCIAQAKDIKFCVVCGNRRKALEPGRNTCKGCTTDADREETAGCVACKVEHNPMDGSRTRTAVRQTTL